MGVYYGMKKIDVLIVFEHMSRELESALLLEKKLIDEGYSVRIVQAGWSENYSHLIYQPKLIIVPWCYDENEYTQFCRYRGSFPNNRVKILNLHCEQVTNQDAKELLLPKGKAKDLYHIAWGEYFRQQLLLANIQNERIAVTGSSRLDFYKEPYSRISKSRPFLSERYKLDGDKKWVLLIGNFSYAEFSKQNLKVIREKGYSEIGTMSKISEDTYFELLKWFQQACSNEQIVDNVEFIYRPHPSELETEQLINIQTCYKNFHVIKDYAIRDWIVNSDLAFSWCSTSAVEVAVANVPVFNCRPIEIPEILRFDILEYINQITCYQEFMETLIDCCNNSLNSSNQEFLNHIGYYYLQSNCSSVDISVEFVKKILNDATLFCERKEWFFFGVRKTISFFVKIIVHNAGLLKKFSKYKQIDNAFINQKELKKAREAIDKVFF